MNSPDGCSAEWVTPLKPVNSGACLGRKFLQQLQVGTVLVDIAGTERAVGEQLRAGALPDLLADEVLAEVVVAVRVPVDAAQGTAHVPRWQFLRIGRCTDRYVVVAVKTPERAVRCHLAANDEIACPGRVPGALGDPVPVELQDSPLPHVVVIGVIEVGAAQENIPFFKGLQRRSLLHAGIPSAGEARIIPQSRQVGAASAATTHSVVPRLVAGQALAACREDPLRAGQGLSRHQPLRRSAFRRDQNPLLRSGHTRESSWPPVGKTR